MDPMDQTPSIPEEMSGHDQMLVVALVKLEFAFDDVIFIYPHP